MLIHDHVSTILRVGSKTLTKNGEVFFCKEILKKKSPDLEYWLCSSKNILACAAIANVIQKFQIRILNVNEQCSFIGLFHPSKKSIIKWPSRLFLFYLLLKIISIALRLPCIGKTVNTQRSKLLQFRILWPLNYRCGGMCADTELTIIFHFYHVDLL